MAVSFRPWEHVCRTSLLTASSSGLLSSSFKPAHHIREAITTPSHTQEVSKVCVKGDSSVLSRDSIWCCPALLGHSNLPSWQGCPELQEMLPGHRMTAVHRLQIFPKALLPSLHMQSGQRLPARLLEK